MRNRLLIIWTVVAALATAAFFVIPRGGSSPTGNDRGSAAAAAPDDTDIDDEAEPATTLHTGTPVDTSRLSFAVDPSLVPAVPSIEPYDGAGAPRPTARIRSPQGTESDIVLDELAIAFPDDAALDAFVARWHAQVIDVGDRDDESGLTDYVVRVDPSTADTSLLALHMLTIEPEHEGTFTVSDDRVLSLMEIAAQEAAVRGAEVSLNWLVTGDSVRDGSATESSSPQGDDAFQWSWIAANAPHASGIDAALQLLYGRGCICNEVKILIADRGFFYNMDFPLEAKMRKGEWNRPNSEPCSGGSSCPFHGTWVTMAAMGTVDNEFGIAGPAAPVAHLIAMEGASDTLGRFKDIKEVAKDERPDIINMSFGGVVTAFVDGHKRKANRWFKKMRDDYGALSFASAGNSGEDVDTNDGFNTPCELTYVVCVGGVSTDGDTVVRADGSNFGSVADDGSVEIYGPFCTFGLKNPDVPGDGTLKTVCGTSLSSPVVAGVAALVKAANPTLGPKQIWQVLRDTAHEDPLGSEVTGNIRRVDAYRAVATAMNVPYHRPTIEILSPTPRQELRADEFIELEARAKSFAELDLPVQWTQEGGVILNSVPTTDPVVVGELSPGLHVFTAIAGDVFGLSSYETVEVMVMNHPPQISISSPAPNTYRYTVEDVLLAGSSSDSDDYYQALPEGSVSWKVKRLSSSDVVFESTGHNAVVPAGTLSAGDYEVTFTGVDDGGSVASDVALLTMLDVPEGESIPQPNLAHPLAGASYSVKSGGTATVRLVGTAADDQDGILPGTNLRWIAEQGDTRIVLCEGGAFGHGPASTTCADVDVEVPLAPGAPANDRWTFTLEAIDSAGLVGHVSRAVSVQAVEG